MVLTILCAILLTVTVLVAWWYENYVKLFGKLNKIPGPKPLPLIGNAFDFLVPPEQLFKYDRRRALEYFPTFTERIFHIVMVTMLKPEDIEIVLSGMKHVSKSKVYDHLHSWLGTGLLTSDGSKWQKRRKILTPAFHFNILREFLSIFNEETIRLVQELKENVNKPYIDVIPPITEFTLQSIAETSMGTKLSSTSESNKNYKQAVYDFGKILTYRIVRPWLFIDWIFSISSAGRKNKQVVKTLHNFSQNVINERKKYFKNAGSYSERKRLAMLDLLLDAKRKGADIDDEGIREEVDTFMFEGHDTTSVAICFILLILANNKQTQDEIRQEILDVIGDSDELPSYNSLQQLTFTERCLKECLRLFPSVPFIARLASEDIQTTTGYTIPKGVMIHVPIFDVHRNPEVWPDPEKFDPDRFLPENVSKRHPFAYIPFSAGPRNCIGQKFALLEIKAVLCGILREFTLEPVDKVEDITFVTDLVLRTKNEIRVKFCCRERIRNKQ